jgi:hypothetical protein
MTPAEWIALITASTVAAQKIMELLNWLKEHPPNDVTQEQLDEANAKMNAAVEKWKETS